MSPMINPSSCLESTILPISSPKKLLSSFNSPPLPSIIGASLSATYTKPHSINSLSHTVTLQPLCTTCHPVLAAVEKGTRKFLGLIIQSQPRPRRRQVPGHAADSDAWCWGLGQHWGKRIKSGEIVIGDLKIISPQIRFSLFPFLSLLRDTMR